MLHVSVKEDEWKQLCTLIQEINVQINKKKKLYYWKNPSWIQHNGASNHKTEYSYYGWQFMLQFSNMCPDVCNQLNNLTGKVTYNS